MGLPHVLWFSILAACIAIAFFVLLTYLLVTDRPPVGSVHLRAGRTKIVGTEAGAYVAGTLIFLVLSLYTYPSEGKSAGSTGSAQLVPSQQPSVSPKQVSTSPAVTPVAVSPLPVQVPLAPTTTPGAAGSRDENAALTFLNTYADAVHSSDLSIEELSNWFVFPLEWFGFTALTDRSKLLEELTPKGARSKFSPFVLIDFRSGANADVILVRVDWTKPSGQQGSARVKFVLVPFARGPSYRISSETDSNCQSLTNPEAGC